mmetsp:Transcript_8732/g.35645  ORF Transcript_8732/g.35645 Transcript_8732/m.35645 type:complete len:468 (-) Transcript_8732:3094-4497(-)
MRKRRSHVLGHPLGCEAGYGGHRRGEAAVQNPRAWWRLQQARQCAHRPRTGNGGPPRRLHRGHRVARLGDRRARFVRRGQAVEGVGALIVAQQAVEPRERRVHQLRRGLLRTRRRRLRRCLRARRAGPRASTPGAAGGGAGRGATAATAARCRAVERLLWDAREVVVHALLRARQRTRLGAQQLGQLAWVAPLAKHGHVVERLAAVSGLAMLAARGVGLRQRLIHIAYGLLRRRLLDEGAPKLEIVGGDHLHSLVEDSGVHGHACRAHHLLHELAVVVRHRHTQRLAARHQRKAASQAGHHQMRGRAHLPLVRLHGEVLHDQFAAGHARDGHRPLHHWRDDLANGAVDCHGHEALQLQLLREHSHLRRDLNVLLHGHVRAGALLERLRCSRRRRREARAVRPALFLVTACTAHFARAHHRAVPCAGAAPAAGGILLALVVEVRIALQVDVHVVEKIEGLNFDALVHR